ncbi:MAG: tripartite tricarboxylate transporter substrate binding protein [Burkholderiales bacterium]|nr:tripartite tricarboxylate transporter substrate binding protein [Burkholderiales bacterium]
MRQIIACLCLTAVVVAAPLPALAQAGWPDRPMRIVVPFPVGGVLDVVTRLIAERLGPVLGQPVIVDVRPGADGNIGTEFAARSAADGYTWLAASPPTTIQPSVRPKTLRYDPLRDFAPVAFIGTSPFLFVVPAALPTNTLQEFIAHARAQPGKLSYAGSARGTVVHLATELFMHDAGIRMEMINYAGQPAAMTDLIAGRVQFMTLGLILAEPQIRAGKLKALAILDQKRHARLPDVPTAAERGQAGLVMSTWFGLAMPSQVPAAIVERVNAEVTKILQTPEVVSRLRDLGVDAAPPGRPQDFARFMREDVARWKKVVRDAGIETD